MGLRFAEEFSMGSLGSEVEALEEKVKLMVMGHLCDQLETWNGRGSWEDVSVTLSESSCSGVMELGVLTSCSQARIPIEGVAYQPTSDILQPLCTRGELW